MELNNLEREIEGCVWIINENDFEEQPIDFQRRVLKAYCILQLQHKEETGKFYEPKDL